MCKRVVQFNYFTLNNKNIFHSFEEANTCVSLWFCFASVVGPALTFRVRQNEHNMTAAEVAAKAGEAQKHTHTDTLTPTHPRVKKYRLACFSRVQ